MDRSGAEGPCGGRREELGLTQSRLAHLSHLLGEAPVPLIVMAVEEAAKNERVAPKAVWRNVVKLARSLAVQREELSA